MKRRAKTESIDFREFMDGSWRQPRRACAVSALAIAAPIDLTVSLHDLLNVPPLIVHGYMIVGTVGVLAIAAAYAGNRLANNHYIELSRKVFAIGGVVFPILIGLALMYLVFANPLLP
ncbi:MAG TPA: hypothetical protein VFK33_10925 [Bacillales bacterium]|nr:hypothetical protein [Bacillales bacterium]